MALWNGAQTIAYAGSHQKHILVKGSIYQIELFVLTVCQILGATDALQCLECHEVAIPKACQTSVTCGQNEFCFTREFRDSVGVNGFHLGCEDIDRCELFLNAETVIGRRSTDQEICYECCDSNDCNAKACINTTSSNPTGIFPTDCWDILMKNQYATNGIYTVFPGDGLGPFQVYCDMTTDGGGWVVIQRREDGSENFYRTWNEYKMGFGNLTREFYLGNEKIHRLTSKVVTMLRIDLEDFAYNTAFATYKEFFLGDISTNYKLGLGVYAGNAGDSLTHGKGMGFTAKDKDVDSCPSNCALRYHGAWWYGCCHNSNLNGEYNNTKFGEGVNWNTWKGYYYSLYRTDMKIRPQH